MEERILVPLDGSELAECVLPHVEAIVNAFSLELRIPGLLGEKSLKRTAQEDEGLLACVFGDLVNPRKRPRLDGVELFLEV